MTATLRKTYFGLLVPAIAGFVILGAAKAVGLCCFAPIPAMDIAAKIVFVISAVTAVALPILMRMHFVHEVRSERSVPQALFQAFEKRILFSGMVAPYLALIAYALDFTAFYVSGTFLLALYAVYYYFPSHGRINLDRRIFRLP